MKKELKGKRITLFLPEFYGYEKYIINEMERTGAKVYPVFTNLYKTSALYRYCLRFLKSFKDKYREAYFIKRLSKISNVDMVFMIAEASVDLNLIKLIRKNFSGARSVLYLWDSVNNCKNVLDYYKEFDVVLTFDSNDAKEYGWKYRPLFFIDQLVKDTPREFDISSICAVSEDRIEMVYGLKKMAEKRGYNIYIYLYCSRMRYIKNRFLLRKKIYRKLSVKDIKFRPLSLEETHRIYDRSKCIADYASKKQTGLTMRTIECLGHQCKLITNNEEIKNADFYSEQNILYYNEEFPEIPAEFCMSVYQMDNRAVYRNYSLKSWLEDILYE